jgi:hypothetical protein
VGFYEALTKTDVLIALKFGGITGIIKDVPKHEVSTVRVRFFEAV